MLSTSGDALMALRNLFKRRKFGPLSVSPAGLIVLCIIIAMIWRIADGVYRDKAIQQDLYTAINFARPIVTEARWIYEKTGIWPDSLNDPRLDKANTPRQIAQVQFLQDQGIRLQFANPEALAAKSIVLRVISRDDGHFLECDAGDLSSGPLPAICKEKSNIERLAWPPTIPGNLLQPTR